MTGNITVWKLQSWLLSAKGPNFILKVATSTESEIRIIQRLYNTCLENRFKYDIITVVWHCIKPRFSNILAYSFRHPGFTSLCILDLLLCTLHGKTMWTHQHYTHIWTSHSKTVTTSTLLDKIGNLAAGVCSQQQEHYWGWAPMFADKAWPMKFFPKVLDGVRVSALFSPDKFFHTKLWKLFLYLTWFVHRSCLSTYFWSYSVSLVSPLPSPYAMQILSPFRDKFINQLPLFYYF